MHNASRPIASYIDHALLAPGLGDGQLRAGCELAAELQVASVCVKPYHVALAAEMLASSGVQVGTVIGFPHGANCIATKTSEAQQAIGDGATELDMVINIGKAIDGDWEFLAREVDAMCAVARQGDSILKVIFETDLVGESEQIIRLCQICTAAGANFVKTSTGFGFVKAADGRYGYVGATAEHVRLMIEHCGPNVKVKASGGIRSYDDALAFVKLGCDRLGTSASQAIVDGASNGTRSIDEAGY